MTGGTGGFDGLAGAGPSSASPPPPGIRTVPPSSPGAASVSMAPSEAIR